jgi:hypothetical protein
MAHAPVLLCFFESHGGFLFPRYAFPDCAGRDERIRPKPWKRNN